MNKGTLQAPEITEGAIQELLEETECDLPEITEMNMIETSDPYDMLRGLPNPDEPCAKILHLIFLACARENASDLYIKNGGQVLYKRDGQLFEMQPFP